MISILTVCGNGIGSSLMLKMKIEEICAENNIEAQVESIDFNAAQGRKADLIVTVKEFASLRMDKNFFGKAVITGNVSKHKLQARADSTEQLIGKRIGFVFNDSVITAPQVNMRIESGNFQTVNLHNYDMLSLYRSLLKEKKDSLDALFEANGWENATIFFSQLA